MSENSHVYAVILAGGGGTRLWPKSRNKTPKQFLRLTSKETMMQLAANRISKVVPWEKMIVVTNEKYEDEVKLQLPQVPAANIICEPKKKDTALAMLTGAMYAKSLDPQAVVINSASDHIVVDEPEFIRVMKAAAAVAEQGKYLVTVGITPTFATSAFGYIKIGDELGKLDRGLSLFKVNSFTEKPNEATARAYISTGKYFWNANMYVWSSQALDEAFAQHMPSLFELTRSLEGKVGKDFKEELIKVYDQAEAISIDYAISEKADNLVLIPGDFGWDDVGDWKVVFNLGVKDLAGNVIIGDGNSDKVHTLTIESQNNLVHVGDRLVALVGVSDMIVVDTPEIVMIAPKSKSQDVKKLVERLKEEGKEEYL
jgi:mannose-1-phosphate guanylyltransferase